MVRVSRVRAKSLISVSGSRGESGLTSEYREVNIEKDDMNISIFGSRGESGLTRECQKLIWWRR